MASASGGAWSFASLKEAAATAAGAAAAAARANAPYVEQQLRAAAAAVDEKLTAALDLDPTDPHGAPDLTYVTERLVAMGMPGKPPNQVPKLSALLEERHGGHYMIWNMSELAAYDYAAFDNQVMEYKFPGSPSPPLELLVRICDSVEKWLAADERNVAIVHCRTGNRRTCSVCACVLAWLGHCNDPIEAMRLVAKAKQASIASLTIPSQVRYIRYFDRLLRGERPSSAPMLLRRIIINTVPRFERTTGGCRPVLDVLRNGSVLWSSQGGHGGSDAQVDAQSVVGIQAYFASDGVITLKVDCIVQGDVVLRCRHFDEPMSNITTQAVRKVCIFRTAFHVGYTGETLRLTRGELDGMGAIDQYDAEFYVDLIFGKVQQEQRYGKEEGVVLQADEAGAFLDALDARSAIWEHISHRKAMSGRPVTDKLAKPPAPPAEVEQAQAPPAAFSLGDDEEEDEEESITAMDAIALPSPPPAVPVPATVPAPAVAAPAPAPATAQSVDGGELDELGEFWGTAEAQTAAVAAPAADAAVADDAQELDDFMAELDNL